MEDKAFVKTHYPLKGKFFLPCKEGEEIVAAPGYEITLKWCTFGYEVSYKKVKE